MSDDLDPKVRAELRALAKLISKQDEKISALSRARQLDVSSIPVTVEDDEGEQSTVDVPLNVGVSQGVRALEVANRVDDGLAEADQKIQDIIDGGVTAQGGTIYPLSFEPPTPPETGFTDKDIWYAANAAGEPVELRSWNGSEWVRLTTLADQVLVYSPDGTISLADGVVTAPKLAADAIDGKEINGVKIHGGLVTGGQFQGGHFSLSDTLTTSHLPRFFADPVWRASGVAFTGSELQFIVPPDASEATRIEYYSGTGTGGGHTGPRTRFGRTYSRFDNYWWGSTSPDPYASALLPVWSDVTRIAIGGTYDAPIEDVFVTFQGKESDESTEVHQLDAPVHPDAYGDGRWHYQWDPPHGMRVLNVSISVPRGETLVIDIDHVAYEAVAGESLQWGKDQAAAYPGLRAYREDQSLHYEVLPSGIQFWDPISGEPTMVSAVDGGLSLTASPAQIAAGTDNTHYVTPKGLGGDTGDVDLSQYALPAYRSELTGRKRNGIIELRFAAPSASVPTGNITIANLPPEWAPTTGPNIRGGAYIGGQIGQTYINGNGVFGITNQTGSARSNVQGTLFYFASN